MCEVCDAFKTLEKATTAVQEFRGLAAIYRREKLPNTNRMWTKLLRVADAIGRVDGEGGADIGHNNPYFFSMIEEVGALRALMLHTLNTATRTEREARLIHRVAESVDAFMDQWGLCTESIHLMRLKQEIVRRAIEQQQEAQAESEVEPMRASRPKPTMH